MVHFTGPDPDDFETAFWKQAELYVQLVEEEKAKASEDEPRPDDA